MSEGRGGAGLMVALAVPLVLHWCALLVSATTWTVGGSEGWTIGPDYTAWAAGKAFATGDVLFFPYATGAHDVVEVDKAGYTACSAASTNSAHSDGNTTITLKSTGTYYFLCSFPSHCTAGMKLAVTVGAATPPAPSPSTTVGTPNSAPASSPASASAPVPSSPAPASASVPTPVSVEGPASTPSPAGSPVPTPVSVETPPSASVTPVGSPPNSANRRLPSAVSLAAALLFLSAAVLTAL